VTDSGIGGRDEPSGAGNCGMRGLVCLWVGGVLVFPVETGLWGGSGRGDAVTERSISVNDAVRLAA
jgi:hypothetical protein